MVEKSNRFKSKINFLDKHNFSIISYFLDLFSLIRKVPARVQYVLIIIIINNPSENKTKIASDSGFGKAYLVAV